MRTYARSDPELVLVKRLGALPKKRPEELVPFSKENSFFGHIAVTLVQIDPQAIDVYDAGLATLKHIVSEITVVFMLYSAKSDIV